MFSFDGGEVTIWTQGDYDFSIRRFDPFLAMRVLGELQKLLVPAIGGAIDNVDDAAQLGGAIGGALLKIAEVVDGDKLEKAVKILLDSNYIAVSKTGQKDFQRLDNGAVTAIFTGRPFDMLALCGKIFSVNFTDFSKSCSVPTGVRQFIDGIKEAFRGDAGNISAE